MISSRDIIGASRAGADTEASLWVYPGAFDLTLIAR